VHVSFNGGASWDLDIEITVRHVESAYSIEPQIAFSDGSTSFVVSSSSLIQIGSYCNFNSVLSPLVIVNRTLGTCTCPISFSLPTIKILIISPSLQSLASFVLPVFAKPKFDAIRPTIASSSQSSIVTIWGSDFLESFRYFCIFADFRIGATFLNSTSLICSSPVSYLSGVISLTIGYGDNLGFSSQSFRFIFQIDIVLVSFSPEYATASAPTTISLFGRNFPNEMLCKFGKSVYSFAFVVSSQHARCSTPLGLFGKMTFLLVSSESASKSEPFPFDIIQDLGS